MAKQKKPARMNTPWCSLAPAHVWQNLPAFSRAAPSTRFPTCRVPVGDRPMGQSACRLFGRSGGRGLLQCVSQSGFRQFVGRPFCRVKQKTVGRYSRKGGDALAKTRALVWTSGMPTRESGHTSGRGVRTPAGSWSGLRHHSPLPTCPSRHGPFCAPVEPADRAARASNAGHRW